MQRCIEIGDLFIGWVVSSMPSDFAPRRANVTSSSKCWGLNITATRPGAGCHFLQDLHPLRRHFIREKCDASEILAWSSQRHGNSRAHRAFANAADDGYAAFTCLEQWHDNMTANGEQKVGLLRDKFGGQFRKSIRSAVGIAEDDFDIAAIDEFRPV